MTFFLISGEASGDKHAAGLVRALRARDAGARFAGTGGEAMRKEGVYLYQDYREMAYMGIVAVLKNLGKVRRNFRLVEQALLKERPDVLVLVDYPSFNLRMAAFCRRHLPATRIVYYIPPKVWAWKRWRVHRIARLTDAVLGIFPFEPAFYARYGYTCHYAGNPTAEEVRHHLTTDIKLCDRPFIAVLPGSRRSEIEHCLPTMLMAARQAAPQYETVVVAAPGQPDDIYRKAFNGMQGVRLVAGDTFTVLRQAEAAIVNSGTATLEAVLTGCPQVAVYHIALPHAVKISGLLFSSKYFTLPNILLQKEVIKEMIGYRFTVDGVATELRNILAGSPARERQLADYDNIRSMLGDSDASANAAEAIMALKQ